VYRSIIKEGDSPEKWLWAYLVGVGMSLVVAMGSLAVVLF